MSVIPPWSGASLTGTGSLVVALLVVVYCVLGEPFVGRWLHRVMEREVARDPMCRWRGYARLLVLEIIFGAASLVLAAALRGIGVRRLGLTLPHPTGSTVLFMDGLLVAAMLVIGIILSTILIWRLDRPIPVVGGDQVRLMVPTRPSERVWFLGLSLAAGVCEELLFRGLLLALLAALLHDPSPWLTVVLGAAAFGVAHAYQGVVGVIATGLLGALLGALYLTTGSLFVVMLVHAAIDARAALLPARAVGRVESPPGPA